MLWVLQLLSFVVASRHLWQPLFSATWSSYQDEWVSETVVSRFFPHLHAHTEREAKGNKCGCWLCHPVVLFSISSFWGGEKPPLPHQYSPTAPRATAVAPPSHGECHLGTRCFKASPPYRHLTFTRAGNQRQVRQLWSWNHPESPRPISPHFPAHSVNPSFFLAKRYISFPPTFVTI